MSIYHGLMGMIKRTRVNHLQTCPEWLAVLHVKGLPWCPFVTILELLVGCLRVKLHISLDCRDLNTKQLLYSYSSSGWKVLHWPTIHFVFYKLVVFVARSAPKKALVNVFLISTFFANCTIHHGHDKLSCHIGLSHK